MMRTSKPKSRVDQAIDIAREAHEMAVSAIVHVQAHRFVIGTILAVLRDMAIIRPEAINNVFLGAAAVIDRVQPTDEQTAQTLAASRSIVAEMAGNFGIAVPEKGQVVFPRKN